MKRENCIQNELAAYRVRRQFVNRGAFVLRNSYFFAYLIFAFRRILRLSLRRITGIVFLPR